MTNEAVQTAPTVRITRATCLKCGRENPTVQTTPAGAETFGTPVPARWLEQYVRDYGITHNGGCGPMQIEIEPVREARAFLSNFPEEDAE